MINGGGAKHGGRTDQGAHQYLERSLNRIKSIMSVMRKENCADERRIASRSSSRSDLEDLDDVEEDDADSAETSVSTTTTFTTRLMPKSVRATRASGACAQEGDKRELTGWS